MSWFSSISSIAESTLQAAQKQAQEAAEKAKALAQQASSSQFLQQARTLAEQATEKAKEIATQAAEEAQHKFRELAQQEGSSGTGPTDDPRELAKYGVTDAMVEYVGSLTYSMFSDYPLDTLPTNPLGLGAVPGSNGELRLTPWQERHALLILTRVEQLQHLRFALCPKRMSEIQFWAVYLTLCKKHLPTDAFGIPSPPSAASAAAPSSAAGMPPLPESRSAGSLTTAASSSGKPAKAAERWTQAKPPPLPPPPPRPQSGTTLTAAALAASATAAAAAASSAPPARTNVDVDLPSGATSAGEAPAEAGGAALSSDLSEPADDPEEDEGLEGGGLEDDPELAAYLEEALGMDGSDDLDGAGASDALGSDDEGDDEDEDLDDYIEELDKELTGATPSTSNAGASSAHTTPAKGG